MNAVRQQRTRIQTKRTLESANLFDAKLSGALSPCQATCCNAPAALSPGVDTLAPGGLVPSGGVFLPQRGQRGAKLRHVQLATLDLGHAGPQFLQPRLGFAGQGVGPPG